jgi:hypothetical protein
MSRIGSCEAGLLKDRVSGLKCVNRPEQHEGVKRTATYGKFRVADQLRLYSSRNQKTGSWRRRREVPVL